MSDQLPRPKRERLSALTALILLAYGLMRMIVLPSLEAELSALGVILEFEFRAQTMMLILSAALAAAGTDWLIGDHPRSQPNQLQLEHWIIPALAAVAFGVILVRIPEGPPQWIGMILGALLLVALLSAEFIVVDAQDPRYELVANALHALALLLLAGMLFAVQAVGLRVLYTGPIVFLACALISGRLMRLTFPGEATWIWALIVGLMGAQAALGLHYWRMTPLRAALLLMLTVYWLHQMVSAHIARGIARMDWAENGIIAAVGLAAILLFA